MLSSTRMWIICICALALFGIPQAESQIRLPLRADSRLSSIEGVVQTASGLPLSQFTVVTQDERSGMTFGARAPGALFRRNVTDAACRTCHSAAIHHANQIYRREVGKQPDCATCHEEHAGRMARPSLVRNSMCTGCHASLQVAAPASGPANRYARTVTS